MNERRDADQEIMPVEVRRSIAMLAAALVGAAQGGDGDSTLDRAIKFDRWIETGVKR